MMIKKYPYTDFNEFNLDWVITHMKDLIGEWEDFSQINQLKFLGNWDITKQYPAWSIVIHDQKEYLSIQAVPAGIDISNTDYWTLAADYAHLLYQYLGDYVTPEMFGAKGDGVTDDTAAVQAAFDSGKNVCFLMSSKYLISDTIHVTNNNGSGRTAFSNAIIRYAPNTRIICSFADSTHPVFKIEGDGWTFENVNVNARNRYNNGVNLTIFDCDTGVADVDFSLINFSAYAAKTIVKINGRGLSIQNCLFASCSRLLHIKWPGEGSIPWHDNTTGQRAFVIENNRFHSFGRESTSFIYVESGNVFGMRFVGNNFDRGYTSFLLAATKLKNWVIENNTFHGMGGVGSNDSFMRLEKGIDGLVFTGNTFVNQVEASYYFTNVLEFTEGDCENIVISNNNFGTIINGSVIVAYSTASTDGLSITGNVVECMKDLSSERGLLYLSTGSPAKNVSITGNVIREFIPEEDTTHSAWMVRASGGLNLSYAKIIGNVIYNQIDRQLSYSGTDNSSNCLYDWTFTITP